MRTPDQRLRVFVSSTLSELGPEREAVSTAIRTLRLSPVMFEAGARPHPPGEVYRSYLAQSDVFVGIYWQSYGWVAPGETISGIEEEYLLSASLPGLIYVKEPAPQRDPRLAALLERIIADGRVSFRTFESPGELAEALLDDLAWLVTDRFHAGSGPAELPSGTLTFLFADLEGSTQLVRQLGDRYPPLLHTYHHILTTSTTTHRGQVVTREGDGIVAVFAHAVQAVQAAVDIQRRLGAAGWPDEVVVRCRIGIHSGTATRTAQGYVGVDLQRAARIGAAANGGQIILSATARSLVEDEVAQRGWLITDLGLFSMEGGEQPERLARLDLPDLAPVTNLPRAARAAPTTLPAVPGPIIGRAADLAGAGEMIRRNGVRLVTLTGPGGTGKTRLAVELARTLAPEFPDGVVFVDLAAVRDPAKFLPAVGRAFGVVESEDRSIVEGLAAVVGTARMLLILDNMEQLLEAAPEVGDILARLPNVKVLATSRSPLRLTAEHEYPLLPLTVPEPGCDLQAVEQADAVALFVERARAVRPDFRLTDENAQVVAEITRRLDGLPLAIELAAARLRLFTPEMLLSRLDNRLSLLDRGPQDAPERHRTLRAAVQWSHDLLDQAEQTLFRRLGVFAGGWTLSAAEAVCHDDRLGEAEVVDLLGELVAKSLVVFSFDEQQGESRYRLLETLREFALEQLQESGEEEPNRRRHLRWCLSLATRLEADMPTPGFPALLESMDRERHNIREALRWSLTTGTETEDALTICGLLPIYWDIRGYVTEGLQWTVRLLELTEEQGATPGRAAAAAAGGWLAMLAGDTEGSERFLATSEAMLRQLGDRHRLAWNLAMHGMTNFNRGELDLAEGQFAEAVKLAREARDEWLAEAWCNYGLAHITLARGNLLEAHNLLHATLEFCRQHGLTWGIGHAQLSLGVLAFMMGDLDQAGARLAESLAVRRQLGDSRGIADCLGLMAVLAAARGEHELAAQLLGAAEVKREASGQRAVPWQQPLLEQANEGARRELGDRFSTLLVEGRALGMHDAIELGIRRLGPASESHPPTSAVQGG